MWNKILLLSLLLCLLGCNDLVKSKTERVGEPDVFNVLEDDDIMNQAIKQARHSFYEFEDAYESNNQDFEFFALKQSFSFSDGDEHIWIGNLTKRNNDYHGTIENTPINDIGFVLGDSVQVDMSKLSDWIYYDNMRVRGGFTIRAIRNSLNEEERKLFDYQNGLLFDD